MTSPRRESRPQSPKRIFDERRATGSKERTMKLICAAALMSCVVGAAALAAQNPMRPGRWEVTTQMQMANVPMKMPETKTTQCVTPEQAKDVAIPGSSPMGRGRGADSCKTVDHKVSGNTVSWKAVCGPPQNTSGTGEIVFNGDSYAGTMKMTTEQGEMTMKMSGKRVGDCTP
jgi:hypothetical protein